MSRVPTSFRWEVERVYRFDHPGDEISNGIRQVPNQFYDADDNLTVTGLVTSITLKFYSCEVGDDPADAEPYVSVLGVPLTAKGLPDKRRKPMRLFLMDAAEREMLELLGIPTDPPVVS
jgi:hypothetical protein